MLSKYMESFAMDPYGNKHIKGRNLRSRQLNYKRAVEAEREKLRAQKGNRVTYRDVMAGIAKGVSGRAKRMAK